MARTKRLPIDHALRMTPEEYMRERVDDQIKWYSSKSRENKRWFMRLEVLAILFSLSIPFVTDFITPATAYVKTVVSFLGVAIAFITALLSLMKYRDNWVEYRATAEQLHRERFMYMTRAGAYNTARSFPIFVQAVEDILSTEVSNWRQNRTQHEDEQHEEEHHETSSPAATDGSGEALSPAPDGGADTEVLEPSAEQTEGDQPTSENSEQQPS